LDYSLIALNLGVPFKLASTDLGHYPTIYDRPKSRDLVGWIALVGNRTQEARSLGQSLLQ
jgi:hypothetical protein